jgi:hypothetical protein
MSNKKKLGQEPAMPYNYHHIKNGEDIVQVHPGMSKRLFIATMAMQGLIAVGYTGESSIAQQAFLQADKLLEQELE